MRILPALLTVMVMATSAAWSQDPEQLTKDGIIAGTMDITFNTRTSKDTSGDLVDGSAALGAKDIYKFNLAVADTTEFAGSITRQPNLASRILKRNKQDAELGFDITLAVRNPADPKQKKTVGKWVGLVPIDVESGAFELSKGKEGERPLRIQVDAVGKATAFEDMFQGKLMGKAQEKQGLAAYTFKRLVKGKTVEVVVKNSDPMKFQSIVLAKGPSESYPRTTVNGRLDYDYETGNWFTDGITFTYMLNGKEYKDKVTGSIKWVEDPDRATNGKGAYEFNLRFNEEANSTATSEGDAFAEGMSDEEAFFVVDNSIPALTGTIAYEDTMVPGEDVPASSKVTYNLNANKLTKQQVMNFFKLWVLAVGPVNDE